MNHKPEEYLYIKAWNTHLDMQVKTIHQLQKLAAEENAPLNAIYRNGGLGWYTAEHIKDEKLQELIRRNVTKIRASIYKEKVNELMEEYEIEDNSHLEDIISFMMDLLQIQKEHTICEYGYATNTVNGIQRACGRLHDLMNWIEDELQ